jgi:non-heme chloroperoxidase
MRHLLVSLSAFFGIVFLLIAFGTRRAPKAMSAINDAFVGADFQDVPALQYVTTRDGSAIAFRYYDVKTPSCICVLIHGSTAESHAMHGLARFLQNRRIACYVPDIRGHGATGKLGDIDYIGQLEYDLEDLLKHIQKDFSGKPIKLVGHSSGGGFALRFAGSPRGHLFASYTLAAPMIHHACSMTRPDVGGWVVPFLPRIIGLSILNAMGLHWFQSLPVLAFAVPEKGLSDGNNAPPRTATYSYRLQDNFRPHLRWQQDVKRVSRPMQIVIGELDELFVASAYKPCLEPLNTLVSVQVLPHMHHVSVYNDPIAMDALLKTLE